MVHVGLNPELALFAKEIRALGGIMLQARLLRNPELFASIENIGAAQPLSADTNPQESVAYEVVRQVITLSLPTIGNNI